MSLNQFAFRTVVLHQEGKLIRPGATFSLQYLLVEEGYHFKRNRGTPSSGSSVRRFYSMGRGILLGQNSTALPEETEYICNSI